jgi:single-strand DNA-binding protein
MLNKWIGIGRLGADPEVRYLQDGSMVTNFKLATTEKWKDNEKTEWHRIVVFKKLAEICANYLKKGKLVYVEGRLQTRSWEDKEVKRYTTEVIISNMKMLDSKGVTKEDVTNTFEGSREVIDEEVPF